MKDSLDGYESRQYRVPSMNEAFLQLGISEKDKQYSKDGMASLNQRAYRWISAAAQQAYATLKVVINFYPPKDRKYITPILEKLRVVVEEDIYLYSINKQDIWFALDQRIDAVFTAVSQAGNIFNNSIHLLPKETHKAVLEARDLCDEAIRQPMLVTYKPL